MRRLLTSIQYDELDQQASYVRFAIRIAATCADIAGNRRQTCLPALSSPKPPNWRKLFQREPHLRLGCGPPGLTALANAVVHVDGLLHGAILVQPGMASRGQMTFHHSCEIRETYIQSRRLCTV